jgi:hypothetical protein
MNERTHSRPSDHLDDGDVIVTERASRAPAFMAGLIIAIVLAAIAVGAFLVISDSDDDGNIDINVPAVDVETTTG